MAGLTPSCYFVPAEQKRAPCNWRPDGGTAVRGSQPQPQPLPLSTLTQCALPSNGLACCTESALRRRSLETQTSGSVFNWRRAKTQRRGGQVSGSTGRERLLLAAECTDGRLNECSSRKNPWLRQEKALWNATAGVPVSRPGKLMMAGGRKVQESQKLQEGPPKEAC